jgi:hypothetical protein
MSDPLRTLLDELAPDVTRARLADPSAVRRRGEQRTHRKIAAAAVVGAVAVIAVALLGTGPLRSLADNTAPPATSPSPVLSATTSPSASASTSARTIHLLSPSALPKSDQGSWRELATALTGGDLNRCLDKLPAGDTTYERWFSTAAPPKPADEVAVHRVDEFATDADADAAFASAVNQVKACWDTTDDTFTGPVVVADAGYVLYGRLDVGLSDAMSMQGFVIVRAGNEVSLLAIAVPGNGDIPGIDKVQASMPQALADLLAKDAQS